MAKWFFLIATACASVAHANGPFFYSRFGNNGAAGIAFDVPLRAGMQGNNDDTEIAAALMPDGRLLLGGWAITGAEIPNPTTVVYPSDLAIGRLLANGQPDPSFGENGRKLLGITTPAGATFGAVGDLITTSDGKIIYSGEYHSLNTVPTVIIGRLQSDGSSDSSFNLNGRRLFTPGAFAADADNLIRLRLKVQPDGKLLAAVSVYTTANSKSCIGIARLLAPGAGDGALDTSFGQGLGLVCVVPPLSGGVPLALGGELIVLPDGRILVGATVRHAGGSGADMGVARLHADGSLDTTFGSNGWAFAAFDQGGQLNDFLNAFTRDAAGRIVMAGQYQADTTNGIAVARISAEGVLDDTFGIRGTEQLPIGDFSEAQDIVAMPDGRLLIAGDSDNRATLVMLKSNGAPDPSFGSGGTFIQGVMPAVLHAFVSGDFLYLTGNHVRTDSSGNTNQDFAALKYLWNAIFADGMEVFDPQA